MQTAEAHFLKKMCTIEFKHATGRDMGSFDVEPGTSWDEASLFLRDTPSLQGLLYLPCGQTRPIDLDESINDKTTIIVSKPDVCPITFHIHSRDTVACCTVRSDTPMKEVVRANMHVLKKGEEFDNMWDPVSSRYANPAELDTPVSEFLKPLILRVRVAPLRVHNTDDIHRKWPYRVRCITELGDGLWLVSSDDAKDHLVYRGRKIPLPKHPKARW